MANTNTRFSALFSCALCTLSVSGAAMAQTPQGAVAPLPAAEPQAPAQTEPTRDTVQGPSAAAASTEAPGGFVPVLKLGRVVSGTGTYTKDCTASGAFSCGLADDVDYDEMGAGGLGADFLWHTSPKLRLGFGGLLTTPEHKALDQRISYGQEVIVFGVIEGLLPTSPNFAISLRAQLGGSVLFAGGDHKQAINENRNSCKTSGFVRCETKEGPFAGASLGLGAGINFRVGAGTRLRVDVLAESYVREIFATEVAHGADTYSETALAVGSRGWLMAGIEL